MLKKLSLSMYLVMKEKLKCARNLKHVLRSQRILSQFWIQNTSDQNFYQATGKLWNPFECVIGSRFDTKRNKNTGTYDQTVQDKFMHVPILSTMESIFKSQHVAEMLKSSETDDSRLRDICDESLFKTHPLFSTEKHSRSKCFMMTSRLQILLVPSEVFMNWVQ